MAKIFINHPEELKDFALGINNFLRKNSGHRMAIYEDQADLQIILTQDWAGGSKGLDILVYDDNEDIINLGKTIVDIFKNEGILSQYPKKAQGEANKPTLVVRVGRLNETIDTAKWSVLVAEGIVRFYNPEFIKFQEESTVKRSEDKTYYDRAFNQNATSNASLIFKKKN
jgi:hypothetical protein